MRLWRSDLGTDDRVRITHIALFCDSDETRTRTVAYFAHVRFRRGRRAI